MKHYHPVLSDVAQVRTLEQVKRDELKTHRPAVYAKVQRLDENAHLGVISPTMRLCWNYLCNFECEHCCAEDYMPRFEKHFMQIGASPNKRRRMTYEDLDRFLKDMDEYGIYRMVLTGGEPTVWPDLFKVVDLVMKHNHLPIMDSNAWFLVGGKFSSDGVKQREITVQSLADAGVYKLQISLDSFVKEEHDSFRKKPGSYDRIMKVLPQVAKAGMKLLVSTCLVKGRAFTQEFEDLCKYCQDLGAMLYVTYAKPTGTCGAHDDWKQWVIDKRDADKIRELELKYDITTHMTPSYKRAKGAASSQALGHYDGCITVKGINTWEPWGDIKPCPYMDVSIGNVFDDPIAKILERGMLNRDLGPQRKDCLIGEDPDFMQRHKTVVTNWQKNGNYLPVPWGEFWTEQDLIQIE